MESLSDSVKHIWRVLWNNKPLLIALLALGAVGIYLLWQNGSLFAQNAEAEPDLSAGGSLDLSQGSGIPGVITGGTVTTDTGGISISPSFPTNQPLPGVNMAPPPGTALTPPNSAPRLYTVHKGDTFGGIAHKLGVAKKHLWNDNRATLSLASAQHGGPYWDKGPGTPMPANIKVY